MVLRDFIPAPGETCDPEFKKIMLQLKQKINDDNDDGLVIFVGPTGSGKSTLVSLGIQIIDDNPSTQYVGLNHVEYAKILQTCEREWNEGKKNLWAWYDEVTANKRQSMSKWNIDLIDIFSRNRMYNVFHFWCYPYIQLLDSIFIEERVNAIILCTKKRSNNGRMYYFFNKSRLLKMLDDKIELKTRNLIKNADKYANFSGRWKSNESQFFTDYLKVKLTQNGDRNKEFFEKYTKGDDKEMFSITSVARRLGVSRVVIARHTDDWHAAGIKLHSEPWTNDNIAKVREFMAKSYSVKPKKPTSPLSNREMGGIAND